MLRYPVLDYAGTSSPPCAAMSKWLNDGEVLVGQGSGEAVPVSPRLRSIPHGSPMPGRTRSPLASPRSKEAASSPQAEVMGKAKELFVLCDKESKGFITKRDMQRLQGELPLSPEQLEEVFESLDRRSNGFLTPVEFNTGLGELVGLEDTADLSQNQPEEEVNGLDLSEDPTVVRVVNVLTELGGDKHFKDQREFISLWYELQKDRPELLSALEGILIHAVSQLQDCIRERDSLEQALRRRESEHDQMVRSIYEDMESQIREEREKRSAQESIRQKQRGELEEVLRIRDQDLENTLSKQKELESRIQQLSAEQANIKAHNVQLRSLNVQLQEQVEHSTEQLQAALAQLGTLQHSADLEQMDRQRNVMRVSRNIQKEKESLLRQLELLRDMNRRLRDEKDAQESQKRTPKVTLQKQGSVIGSYMPQEKPLQRQLSSSEELEQTKEPNLSGRVGCDQTEQVQTQKTSPQTGPQRVFKVVFLGNSGVGKTSFIHRSCTGELRRKLSATVGIDFQMKTLTVGSATVTLQLWDTAGQERFCSITEQYYRKADGILAMYDLTQSASFAAVRGWMHSVKEKACDGAVLVLLANKLDRADRRQVAASEGQGLAKQHQALFYECSARNGCNIEEVMTELASTLVTRHDRQCEAVLSLTTDTDKKSCCV
ncbi:EF-hand calcium-binding domain-containing protein 4A isoform X1 [Takifugu rubripes]|nr:EF-hand calcium-binding domain-containing protein 4A isoform X1 [Takifugu rubripes]